jgi:membrane-associated phospholipid phosphatase
MQKILMILLWPAGLAVIIGIGAILASRGSGQRAAGRPAPGHRFAAGRLLSGRSAVTRFFVALLAGVAIVYLIGVLIGLIAVHLGPPIDKPVWHAAASHQAHAWVSVMKKATQTAASFTVAGAAATAAVCLVFVWRRDRWLPPTALAALIVVDHYLTMALTGTFNRVPPPHSGGTFPSGASDRAVAYYGLIAFLLWRAVSGRRRAAIWAGTAVAALAFTEAYSRGYLVLHWFTDIVGGLVYGTLLLTAFIVAVNAAASGRPGGDIPEAVPGSEITGAYAARVPGVAVAGSTASGAHAAGASRAGAGVPRAAGGSHIAGEGAA